MGRFYKGAPGHFVQDKMFKIPFEEMAGVMAGVDKNIDEAYDKGDTLLDSLDIDKLDMDDPAVAARYKHYQGVVDNSTKDMNENVLNYTKHIGTLRKASRELSTDMKTGVLGRAQEQFDDYNTITADIDARTDLSQEDKDLKKAHVLFGYKKAGALNFDAKVGTFNKIKEHNSDLVGGIVDEGKYLEEVDKGFQFHSVGGGGSRAGKLGGKDVIITGTSSKSERSASRVKSFIEADLDSKNYLKNREQHHQMILDMNEPTQFNEDGTPKTAKELAQEDRKTLIEKGVLKLTGKKGHYNERATVVPGQGGSGRGNGGKPGVVGIEIDDISATTTPEATREKTKQVDSALDSIFNFNREQTEVPNHEYVEAQDALFARGFTSTEGMVSTTLEGYSQSKLTNLAGGLVEAGIIPGSLKEYQQNAKAVEWLNAKAVESTIVTKIIPELPSGEEPTAKQINEATVEVARMFNNTDQTQKVGDIYVIEDGVSKKLEKGMSFSTLANSDEDYVYTAPTGKGLAQTKLKGNDETGWLTAGGAPITADEDNEDAGIKEGDTLTQKQILAVYGDLKMIGTEKVAGANIYNNTDNLIQVDKNNIKQEVYTQVSAIGTKTQVKRYVATVKVFKTPKAEEGKKGKHVIVKMILNPEEYKVVFK